MLDCTALQDGPAAGCVLETPGECHLGVPGTSVSSTEEAAAAAQRNAAAPPGWLQGVIPDDPTSQEREREHECPKPLCLQCNAAYSQSCIK